MPRFSRLETLNEMERIGLVPVFYEADQEVARRIVHACAEAGARVVEFTNRGDLAYRVFCDLAEHCSQHLPHVILGVGSVVDPGTAALYINSGANFVVGPILNPEVAKVCNRRKVPYLPGCGSASEIGQAEELGCEIVKLFPGAEVGGPSFVKALLAPCPWTKIMPTGGVDASEESVSAWIKAGCVCLGMGSKLITKDAVAARDFAGITERISRCLWWIKKARGIPVFLGVDHVAVYPPSEAAPAGLVGEWYTRRFPGLRLVGGETSDFVAGTAGGCIEAMHKPSENRAHIAIRVADFDEAVRVLRENGVELDEPTIRPGGKSAFLKETDPAGHRVHIVWVRG